MAARDLEEPAVGRSPDLSAWWGPILIAVAAMGMLAWTWGTWPDVLVDFGHERYIPWRLAEGEVLYRDIAFYNGPLSQYFNALAFRVFGASLRTLVFCNLALLAILIAMLYYAMGQISGRPATVAACLIFVLLFAFGQYRLIGNYNYVCPYSHEMTHGLILSLAGVLAVWPSGRRKAFWASLGGLAIGLAFLTKAEVFLAGAVAAAAGLLMGLWFERPGWRRGLVRLCCFLAAAIAPAAIAFFCLASAMPARQAWLGTLGSWVVAARSDVRQLPFFQMLTGLDHPAECVGAMLSMTGLYAIVLAPAGLLSAVAHPAKRDRTAVAFIVFVVAAGFLWLVRSWIDWGNIARPLPLLLSLVALGLVIGFLPRRREEAAQRRFVRQFSLLVFALALLAKMLLAVRIYHYGFVLAMPATLLLGVAAFDWLPAFFDRRGGDGGVFAAAAGAIFVVAGLTYLSVQAHWIGAKTVRVGAGADAFLADDRGVAVNAAVVKIAVPSSRASTLAALPEGTMINCLCGLRNPTPYINLMPVEWIVFGEDRILDSFQSHPPDLIALVHKDTGEFGFRFFGRDYCRRLDAWILANYRPLSTIGATPFQDDRFGILLMERSTRLQAEGRPPRQGARREGAGT